MISENSSSYELVSGTIFVTRDSIQKKRNMIEWILVPNNKKGQFQLAMCAGAAFYGLKLRRNDLNGLGGA